MFKNIFLTGLVSAVLSITACLIYSTGYFSIIVDFSEGATFVKIASYCLLAAMSASFVYFGISKIFKKGNIAEFVFNLIFALVSLLSVFNVLNSLDPEFVNEDAMLMIDYYKGFIMPMLFFPALGWMIAKPLFHKS